MFNTKPIGCPIRYIPSQSVKKYYSEISKDTYVINQNITASKREEVSDSNDKRITVIEKEWYETDGVFCSFPCCLSWIRSNKHIRLYDNSEFLLHKIYNTINSASNSFIQEAPSWRLLIENGGHLSILEFRSGFNKTSFIPHGHITTLPRFRSIGMLYEEKLQL